jgi:hypothetical protein
LALRCIEGTLNTMAADDRSDDKPKAPLARYTGPDHAAPYPISRMAPAFDLVDVAKQIQDADALLGTVTTGKLVILAEQIKRLQAEAMAMLEKTKLDAELHRVPCNFEKRPGGVVHLYERANGTRYFSLLAPDEWISKPAQTCLGSYRLESDASFTPLAQASDREAQVADAVRLLLGPRD